MVIAHLRPSWQVVIYKVTGPDLCGKRVIWAWGLWKFRPAYLPKMPMKYNCESSYTHGKLVSIVTPIAWSDRSSDQIFARRWHSSWSEAPSVKSDIHVLAWNINCSLPPCWLDHNLPSSPQESQRCCLCIAACQGWYWHYTFWTPWH